MSCSGRIAKRALDLSISLVMLIALFIPLTLLGIAIKLEDGGPTFFRQQRIGKDGKRFRIWKFRTMSVMHVDPSGPQPLRKDDPLITKVGRALRKLGLDELPQLLNVLQGEMSLVGPRPTLGYQVLEYSEFQRQRLKAKPGITSFAVVSGRNALSWDERIKLDIWYIDHWSLGLDIRILLRTLWRVLITREGLYGEGGVNDTFIQRDEASGNEVQRDK